MVVKSRLYQLTTLGALLLTEYSHCMNACAAESVGFIAATQHSGSASKGNTCPDGFSGNISWYGAQFQGKQTASGEIFDMNKPTAAHRMLPFQTRVLVENPRTGRTVIVKVNDRGPHVTSRVMDLSKEGARRLGTLMSGIAYVDCLVIH